MEKSKNKNSYKTSKSLATFCASLIAEKLASDITLLDIRKYDTAPADFFVLCSSGSSNHSQAILDAMLRQAKNAGIAKPRVEGDSVADWILIDFFDVVVHVMLTPIREYYNLEKLWKEAIFYKFDIETGKLNKIAIKDSNNTLD